MDTHTVTNAEFSRFIEDTGHVTLAEKPANAADYPGAKPELLSPAPWSSERARNRSTCEITSTGGTTYPEPAGATLRDRTARLRGSPSTQ
jgi:formylglycine-generating enzyme required for sulfatase activity